jgi:hypothetical protein
VLPRNKRQNSCSAADFSKIVNKTTKPSQNIKKKSNFLQISAARRLFNPFRMSNLEFIEEWNNIIPYKIKEADLVKPTEKFMFKAIMAIMKLMYTPANHLNNVMVDREVAFQVLTGSLFSCSTKSRM